MNGRNPARPASILVVEDDKAMRTLLADFVRRNLPGHTVLDLADGASALNACDTHRPRLVLMDIRLPDADGIELTAQMRERHPDLKVIIVSYLNDGVFVERASAAGAVDYVVKDNLFADLRVALMRHFHSRPPAPSNTGQGR